MARRSPHKPGRQSGGSEEPSAVTVKLQIVGAVFLPMLLLGLWLRSQGFW